MSRPQICPSCQYVNRPGLLSCCQCHHPLETAPVAKSSEPSASPISLVQEFSRSFKLLGGALFLFLGAIAYFLTTLREVSFLFNVIFFVAGLSLFLLCLKQSIVAILLLIPFHLWFCVSQQSLLAQPTWFSYWLISLMVLMGLLEINLFYFWMTRPHFKS